MFAMGAGPFSTLLADESICPEAILVCGFRLWPWVLRGLPGGFSGDPESIETHSIGPAQAMRMMHPSSPAFQTPKWRPKVQSFLQEVQTKRAIG
jgi:hypothetical protein